MKDKYNEYISQLKLDDFKILLKEFDIELDEETQEMVLSIIKNDQYQFIIENYIKKLTSEFTCQKIIYLLDHYFKPLLKV